MRIAQVSTLSAPVRRESGGSVESLIWLLTRELVRLGHEVTVFGCAGSECADRDPRLRSSGQKRLAREAALRHYLASGAGRTKSVPNRGKNAGYSTY